MSGWKPVVDQLSALLGEGAQLVSHSEKPWASITFSGAMHRVVLKIEGEDANAMFAREDAFTAALPEHEFNIPGQRVADAGVVEADHGFIDDAVEIILTIEVLLLEAD